MEFVDDDFAYTVCCSCSVEFYMTKILTRLRKRDHATFYCPNGHQQHFTDGETTEEVQKENKVLKIRVTHLEDQLQAAKEHIEDNE